MKFRIKLSIWEDFKVNPNKYGFNYISSMKICEYDKDYLNGKLWVYRDGTLEATYYLDTVNRRVKIIKELLSKHIIEIKE